jgi:two-component system, OmpR family, phosphate regulon sensor histidine kinase PhoR
MRPDLWRLAGLLAAGLLIGFALSQPLLGVAVALIVFIVVQFHHLRQLHDWLFSRSEHDAPVLPGVLGDLVHELNEMRAYHRQREEKLAQFLQRFQEASAALQDAIVMLDELNRIEWANAKAVEYLGVRWPRDSGQRLINLIRNRGLQDFLEQRDPARDSKGISLPSPEQPGRTLEYRLMPYGDKLRLLITRDVTQIQQINQMRRDFIANASHELRTPLTVIAGYLEAMEGDEKISQSGFTPQVKQMRKQTARMQALIEDLLTLSSLETEFQAQKEEVVSVPDMLTNIYKEAKAISGERNHIFSLEAQPDLRIRGNPKELYSAFSNLIMNAVQYTPARGVINIRWYADPAGAHMQVSDTGEGIAAEHIPRLTERFYRVDRGRSRDSGGTGLGLAIVKHILTRHQARLHIESEPGKGSVFRCDFKPDRIAIQQPGKPADTAHSSF